MTRMLGGAHARVGFALMADPRTRLRGDGACARIGVSIHTVHRRISMRAVAAGGAMLFLVLGGARAADAPDLIGTWTRTEHQIAYAGQSPYYTTKPDPAKMTNGADTGPTWVLKIETQDGR